MAKSPDQIQPAKQRKAIIFACGRELTISLNLSPHAMDLVRLGYCLHCKDSKNIEDGHFEILQAILDTKETE